MHLLHDVSVTTHFKSTAPLLSVVIDDFLRRYDPENKSMLGKLTGTLAILVELVGDKSINQILQADLNNFFDEVQKLPVRRDSKKFTGMSIKQIIIANDGPCIAEKTFTGTHRACISVFIQWAVVHYKDQGFPDLSVKGAIYRGIRAGGINKQRAMKFEELQKLFGHPKMKKYAASSETAHYCWLPLVGLFTGCRINELCQLNPFSDIVQDAETGIYYFHFTDEGETSGGVDKSIKTKSSKRIVPIHSKLLELGFLNYVAMIKRGNHKIIFPEWKQRNGKASANVTKWFARYLDEIGLKDDAEGARLSGFHSFRHTFVTHGMEKIAGVFSITRHETETVDGFGKISTVAKGYWTRDIADNILEKQITIEKFDYGLSFYRPSL
ncbi:site-specific integrase [Methylobacter sp.]|uniref:site-specific integrase n=1 Tax=Methylobacter sp. TaxID=2051955 RepID=UPI002FDD5841